MLLKRASCFLSFVDPETYFYFLRKYKLQLKTYYLNILFLSVIMMHTEVVVQRDVLVSWLKFQYLLFKLQNILKKPKYYKTRFTKAHYILEM